jgi:hypothetical protein
MTDIALTLPANHASTPRARVQNCLSARCVRPALISHSRFPWRSPSPSPSSSASSDSYLAKAGGVVERLHDGA